MIVEVDGTCEALRDQALVQALWHQVSLKILLGIPLGDYVKFENDQRTHVPWETQLFVQNVNYVSQSLSLLTSFIGNVIVIALSISSRSRGWPCAYQALTISVPSYSRSSRKYSSFALTSLTLITVKPGDQDSRNGSQCCHSVPQKGTMLRLREVDSSRETDSKWRRSSGPIPRTISSIVPLNILLGLVVNSALIARAIGNPYGRLNADRPLSRARSVSCTSYKCSKWSPFRIASALVTPFYHDDQT
jgi:hypothetical protein